MFASLTATPKKKQAKSGAATGKTRHSITPATMEKANFSEEDTSRISIGSMGMARNLLGNQQFD